MRVLSALFFSVAISRAASQDDFYIREEIPLPPKEVMEIGSIALKPDHQIAVSTRRGDIWICSGPYGDDLTKVTWKKFAEGLHEPLGMFWQDGSLVLTQRPEVTRLTDQDGDGMADRFETICNKWGIKGDYHEFAFGSTPDKNGDIWVALCLTATAGDTASYSIDAWTYILQHSYGSPEVDKAIPTITKAVVAPDKMSVRLTIAGLVRGHVHHLDANGVRSGAGQLLWHSDAWYTLNEIPN